MRDTVTSESIETCDKVIETVKEFEDSKPWIAEGERQDVIERADETKAWIYGKIEEQSNLQLHEDPAFTNMDVVNKMKKLSNLFEKVSKKKKPREPKKKKEDKKEESD